MKPIEVGPVAADVAAPPALVFQMLAAIGQGGQPNGERAEILQRDGDEYICDFWTRILRVMRAHFEDVVGRAEARAARSRVFAAERASP